MAIYDQHQFHPGSQCWCGGAHGAPTWTWPSTSYTISTGPPKPEFSDNGYVGRHRT